MLTDAQIERYSRQILIPELSGRGQAKLLASSVAIHGQGVAAATATTYLAAAGIRCLAVSPSVPAAPRMENPDTRIVPWETTRAHTAYASLPVACSVAVITEPSEEWLAAACAWGCEDGRTVIWGDDAGAYGILVHPSAPGVSLVPRNWIGSPDSSWPSAHRPSAAIARAFFVGTQLAALAMATILGWQLPAIGKVFEYDEVDGVRHTASTIGVDRQGTHEVSRIAPTDREWDA